MGLTTREFYVKDLVIDDEYGVIKSDATIEEAAKLMKELGVPDLVVLDEEQKVMGIIADFDIIQNILAEGLDPKTTKVDSAMYVITPVSLETPVKEAFERMRDLQVNVVPVIKNGKLLGVCTIQDCWSYIPDENVDMVGLIPVKNTKAFEFWFASVFSVISVILGIILPLAGVYGFFIAAQSDLLSLFNTSELIGGNVTFYIFQARGIHFFFPYLDLVQANGPIWVIIFINSLLLLIFGIIGMISILYTSFCDMKHIETNKYIRIGLPLLMLIFMILEWILQSITLAIAVPTIPFQVDALGLAMSIISMILIIIAINRDYLFKDVGFSNVKDNEV
ncbi:MAG: CBS domain-containing protein [Candidatus Lokiarchaeota archaeon]